MKLTKIEAFLAPFSNTGDSYLKMFIVLLMQPQLCGRNEHAVEDRWFLEKEGTEFLC